MKPIQSWLDEYRSSHRNPTNKALHWLCIPPIVFAVFGLLRALPFGDELVNGGTLAVVLTLIYYCLLSWRLALGMVGVFAVLYWGVQYSYTHLDLSTHLTLMVTIFVIAWIGQFVGHKVEGAKPSFFKDLQFLLIGPLWLLADLYRRLHLGIGGRGVAHG
ncbi:MAG: hypothetical protein JWR16_343 [Nevskia sp.]|nr:hypothetical protein [Nevskia sp.]